MSWESNIDWQTAKLRANYIHKIREFFIERDVVEVETPLLCHGTVTDVYLEAFKCQFDYEKLVTPSDLYLQTSPEFAMKRLIASGYGSIFQLCKAFRHEESGRFHNPEFSMLEWYRIGFDHFELMDEVDDLLALILKCDQADRYTYQEVFLKHLNIDPLACSIETLKYALHKYNIMGDWIEEEQDIDILLQVLFSECIESKIGLHVPCFVYNFPKNQASLARISQDNPFVAERFECYFKGIELANGFNELTDSTEQKERFQRDNIKRQSLEKNMKPVDSHFIEALDKGLPQCSGVALGVDRLLMIALNKEDISATMTFNINNA
ncbi:MAG: elongation factor P--(R)-beta-lysine ligase [Thalassotalea sp.]